MKLTKEEIEFFQTYEDRLSSLLSDLLTPEVKITLNTENQIDYEKEAVVKAATEKKKKDKKTFMEGITPEKIEEYSKRNGKPISPYIPPVENKKKVTIPEIDQSLRGGLKFLYPGSRS